MKPEGETLKPLALKAAVLTEHGLPTASRARWGAAGGAALCGAGTSGACTGAAPFVQRLEQRLVARQVGQLAGGGRDVFTPCIRLEVPLADLRAQGGTVSARPQHPTRGGFAVVSGRLQQPIQSVHCAAGKQALS